MTIKNEMQRTRRDTCKRKNLGGMLKGERKDKGKIRKREETARSSKGKCS